MKPKNRSARIIVILFLTALICLNFNTAWSQEKITVKVYPELKRQKILSIGGDYCQARLSNSAWDMVGERTLKEFHPADVRVALPLKFRRQDYSSYKGAAICQQPLVISVLESIKRMKSEFGVKSIILSVWDVPNTLVEDSTKRNQRIIKPESYDEIIDMLTAFLLKAKNDYGTEVDYFSFNESDGGWQILFSPQATIAFIKKAMARFQAAGLKTKFLLADTAHTLGTVEFATQILADSSIWKFLGPLCFHSWWSEKIPDAEFERVAAFAKAENKPVWCDELGFDAEAHKIKGMFQSWDYAFRFAKIEYRVFKFAEAEVSMYWTWQNDYSIMSYDTKTLYPSYYITKHMVEYMNTGTQIVQSLSSDPEILSLTGINENGNIVLQLINLKGIPVSITIEGLNHGIADIISSTESNNWLLQKNAFKVKKGLATLQILPESVNTLVIN